MCTFHQALPLVLGNLRSTRDLLKQVSRDDSYWRKVVADESLSSALDV